jgi:hypothetical protein
VLHLPDWDFVVGKFMLYILQKVTLKELLITFVVFYSKKEANNDKCHILAVNTMVLELVV